MSTKRILKIMKKIFIPWLYFRKIKYGQAFKGNGKVKFEIINVEKARGSRISVSLAFILYTRFHVNIGE